MAMMMAGWLIELPSRRCPVAEVKALTHDAPGGYGKFRATFTLISR
jgi:hypothetical protein